MATASLASPIDRPGVITEDIDRFSDLLGSAVPDLRIEGIQGLSHLKDWSSEKAVLALLDDPSPSVRREAVLALSRLGTEATIPHLIALLDCPSWEIRQNAWIALRRMTAQPLAHTPKENWAKWWQTSCAAQREQALLQIANSPMHRRRHEAVRALVHLATPSSEPAILLLLTTPCSPALKQEERDWLCQALERIGSANSIPVLASQKSDAAAWALGKLGGAEAEEALLTFPMTLPVLLALDRLESTKAGPLVPRLVARMGLITYRSQPDDVMNKDLQPIQRVGANLIRRSGLAPTLIECVLQKLEDTMQPPIPHGPCPPAPAEWTPMLQEMESELKPGFVRGDGATTSQPVAALCYTAEDPALAARLVPLLHHPAVVVRVYIALTLGRLQARDAVPVIAEIVREGYTFSDSVAMASGKHFDKSQFVRWRGFFCMALGRIGGEVARQALEEWATDPEQPRDIRYGSVIGLGFLNSPKSLAALKRVAHDDIIWMVRDSARRVTQTLEAEKG